MSHHRRCSTSSLIIPVLLALMLALAFSCSEDPAALDKEPGDGFNGSGRIDPGTSGSFLLGSVSDSVIARGHLEVWAMNVAFDDSMGMVTFDVQILNRTERNLFPPIHFVITDIRPDDIAVVDFDGVSGDNHPFYDFSAKLGSDHVLTPGEKTEPVTMKFHTVTARSFAIGFRIELGPPAGGGTIGGVVFRDDNRDGKRERCDRCEPGIPGITVALERNFEGEKVILLTKTDENGEYRFAGLRAGVYTVAVVGYQDKWEVTSTNPLLITLVKGPDGTVQDFLGAHFGLFPLVPPGPSQTLFGPIVIGPMSPFGTVLDSTFVNPPSMLPIVYAYYLEVGPPPIMTPIQGIIDSAAAWINGEMVFEFHETNPPDTAYFGHQTVELRPGLVVEGENTIRLLTMGDEHAALMWRVYKEPKTR